jgi:predicted kinase
LSREPQLPPLVLVAGAPATGKTTLADLLGRSLHLPVLHRDHISHAMADAFEPNDPAVRRVLIPASFRVFYALMDDLLDAGGVVAETNFQGKAAEADLRPRCVQSRPVLIHCTTNQDVSFDRFRRRFAEGERHWSSFDDERLALIDAGELPLPWANATVLEIGIPTLLVDTTDGYKPALDAILAFVRSSTA